MTIIVNNNILKNKINFGNSTTQNSQLDFKKEYDEFVSKTQNNKKISKIPFIDFNKKADVFVDAFNDCRVTKKDYIKCILKFPILSVYNPQTLIKNINKTVNKFQNESLTNEAYLKAALKQPTILALSPDKLEQNIRGISKNFEAYGLFDIDYLKMALKQPTLFSQSPEGISKNINKVIERYHQHGLTPQNYIKAIKKYPSIACLSPDTINKNISNIVDKYSKYGLTEEKYIEMLKYVPLGFNLNTKNKIASIDNLVNALKPLGMTEEKCIQTFLRQKVVMFNNLEALAEKIKFLTFAESEKILDSGIETKFPKQCLDNALMKNLSYSQNTNYLLLLRNKLKTYCNKQIKYRHIKDNIDEFIKENSGITFEFKISKSEYTKDFCSFIENYSKNLVGKNIFNIVLR